MHRSDWDCEWVRSLSHVKEHLCCATGKGVASVKKNTTTNGAGRAAIFCWVVRGEMQSKAGGKNEHH